VGGRQQGMVTTSTGGETTEGQAWRTDDCSTALQLTSPQMKHASTCARSRGSAAVVGSTCHVMAACWPYLLGHADMTPIVIIIIMLPACPALPSLHHPTYLSSQCLVIQGGAGLQAHI
jgi:hypothetical protein